MTGQENSIQENMAEIAANGVEASTQARSFLPDLCSTGSVLSLILVGELLALALCLNSSGVAYFSWSLFGLTSILVQWVLLASAATLCAAKRWLSRLSPSRAVSLSYAVVLTYTVVFSVTGLWLTVPDYGVNWSEVLSNVLVAAIVAGVLFRYLYLQQRLKYQEQAELSARVQALQSRIRPHFLFNSLNSIASLISVQPELAEKLVVDLSQLFRASLQLPQLVPIEKEITICKSFADIESVRLGSRLQVDWQVTELPQATTILNLLLQPLLENAIYHGIQPLPEGGRVDVEVKSTENDIVLRITNPRLPGSEHVGSVNHTDPKPPSSGNGIALSNIRRRLSALYGEKAYLRVVKGEDDFSVIVRYPATGQAA